MYGRRLASHGDQRVDADVEGGVEAGAADVGEVAVEVLPLGVGDRVDEDVQVAFAWRASARRPCGSRRRRGRRSLPRRSSRSSGQRPDAALDQRSHRAEADVGALVVERLGDAPGDRMVVGDAEDERLLALEQPSRSQSSAGRASRRLRGRVVSEGDSAGRRRRFRGLGRRRPGRRRLGRGWRLRPKTRSRPSSRPWPMRPDVSVVSVSSVASVLRWLPARVRPLQSIPNPVPRRALRRISFT